MPNYTPCQEQAKEDIEHFLLGSDQDVMILSAPAGRGKSYLLDNILGDTSEVNEFARILDVPEISGVKMAAMSNKAARVIKGITFDSLYGLFPKPDFKTGKTYRQRSGGKGSPQFRQAIVIDEAGMLDSDGVHHMAELSQECKIILSCDRYQLPPVGEDESPIFTSGIPMVEMHTPVRQSAGSPLLELCDNLRDGVANQYLVDLVASEQVEYIDDPGAEAYFATMTENDRVLTYTNDLAIRLNQIVREYKGITGFWQVGETLVSNGVLKVNNSTVLSNEEELTVLEVGADVTNQWGMSCRVLHTSKGAYMVPLDPSELAKVMNRAKRTKDWHTFYSVKETVPDFRGTWASTVHKSQGSTFDSVFINLNDLKKARWQDMNVFLRLLYVAVSRAKIKVYLYGTL